MTSTCQPICTGGTTQASPEGKAGPASIVSPSIHMLISMCHSCSKPRSRENPCFLCQHCRMVAYCGLECRTKAWPKHKYICIKGQRVPMSKSIIPAQYALNTLYFNHRDTLSTTGVHALELYNDPSRSQRLVVVVEMSGDGAAEHYATLCISKLNVSPIGSFGEGNNKRILDDMDSVLKLHCEKTGDSYVHVGVFAVVFILPDGHFSHAPMIYKRRDYLVVDKQFPWKEVLLNKLNES